MDYDFCFYLPNKTLDECKSNLHHGNSCYIVALHVCTVIIETDNNHRDYFDTESKSLNLVIMVEMSGFKQVCEH